MDKFVINNSSSLIRKRNKDDSPLTINECEKPGPSNINSEPEVKGRRKKIRVSTVWRYFKASSDQKLAKCCECGREYKTSGNTSNLSDHLKRFHPALLSSESSVQGYELNEDGSSVSGSGESSSRSSVRSISPFFRKALQYDNTSQRKKSLDEALVLMIAQDFQPFTIVRDKGFKRLVNLLDPIVLPSPDTLKNKLLSQMYMKTSQEVRKKLDGIKYVAITTDIWTSSSNESYICVSCHFIDLNFNIGRAILATTQMDESHTAENIAREIKEICMKWSIFDKISCIVTDNAANMLKACDILKKRHIPCFAHTMNLAVQENFKNTNIQPVIKKCKKFFKSSSLATTKFKEEQRLLWRGTDDENITPYKLIQEVATRWNSCYQMIKRVLLTANALNATLLKLRNAPPPLTADDIEVLKDLEKCLTIFDNATEKISGNKYVTASLIIPITYGIYNYLTAANMSTDLGKMFCQGLIESTRVRLFQYETRTITRISTILDPRFKKDGFRSLENANQASCFLEQEMSQLIKATKANQGAEGSEAAELDSSSNSGLFRFPIEKMQQKSKNHIADTIIIKRQYLERENLPEDGDPLLFWKVNNCELNPMQELALKYFCIPGSSVESERNFSSAGLLISDRRSRIKAKYVDMLIFVNKKCVVIDIIIFIPVV